MTDNDDHDDDDDKVINCLLGLTSVLLYPPPHLLKIVVGVETEGFHADVVWASY